MPLSAIISTSFGGGASPVTTTNAGLRVSSLSILIVPALAPTLVGWEANRDLGRCAGATTSG